MEIKDRIVKIMTSEGLTASAFADYLGVQRPNISHILNGRNGPSLDLIQKILTAFPKFNADWLVTGQGDIYKHTVDLNLFEQATIATEPKATPEPTPDNNQSSNSAPNEPQQTITNNDNQQPDTSPQTAPETQQPPTTNNTGEPTNTAPITPIIEQITSRSAEVKQIVVLYTDNTFAIYNKN